MVPAPRSHRPLLIAIVLILLAAGFYPYWFSLLGGYLVHAEAPIKADAIVVLAGDFTGERILTAGQLMRNGWAPVALVSGPGEFYGLHESDMEIPFALRQGYPESYFVALPNESKSTSTEADAVIPELRRRNAHRVDIVTSSFHTHRAWTIYRSKAPDLEIRMVESPSRYFTPRGWWKNREGRKIFLSEWLKTIGGWLRL